MTLTIEFMRTRSPVFARVLSIARTISTFKERETDGLTLYSVDFKEKDFESAQAFLDHVRGWKGVVFYIDGKVAPRLRAVRLVFDRCLGRATPRPSATCSTAFMPGRAWPRAVSTSSGTPSPHTPGSIRRRSRPSWGIQIPGRPSGTPTSRRPSETRFGG